MLRVLRNRNVLLCGLFPNVVREEISMDEYKHLRGLHIEDPWERVKIIFSKDDHGDIHPEMKQAKQIFHTGLIIGGGVGGALNCIRQAESFVRKSQTEVYRSSREALRAFSRDGVMTFVNGAVRLAPVFGIFLGGFSLVSSCCEAYRGKPEIIDSTVAGFVLGGLNRFMFGIKGMISGAVVGGTLGTIYGITQWGACKILKKDQMELKHAQFAYSQYRQLVKNQLTPKSKELEQLEKVGVHPVHVVNPLNELDSDKNYDTNR